MTSTKNRAVATTSPIIRQTSINGTINGIQINGSHEKTPMTSIPSPVTSSSSTSLLSSPVIKASPVTSVVQGIVNGSAGNHVTPVSGIRLNGHHHTHHVIQGHYHSAPTHHYHVHTIQTNGSGSSFMMTPPAPSSSSHLHHLHLRKNSFDDSALASHQQRLPLRRSLFGSPSSGTVHGSLRVKPPRRYPPLMEHRSQSPTSNNRAVSPAPSTVGTVWYEYGCV